MHSTLCGRWTRIGGVRWVVTIRRRKWTCGFWNWNLKLTNGTEDWLDLTKEETTTAMVAKIKTVWIMEEFWKERAKFIFWCTKVGYKLAECKFWQQIILFPWVLMSADSADSTSADPASPKTSTGWLHRPTALFAAHQSWHDWKSIPPGVFQTANCVFHESHQNLKPPQWRTAMNVVSTL